MSNYNKPIFIIFLFVLFIPKSFCQQQDLQRLYNDKLMYRMGSSFHVGTEKFTFNQLEGEFKMSELGLDFYKKAKRNKTTGMVLSGVSLLTGIIGITYISNNSNNNYRNASYILGGQIVLSLAAGFCHKKYNEWLDRAIWQRNKDLLFPK